MTDPIRSSTNELNYESYDAPRCEADLPVAEVPALSPAPETHPADGSDAACIDSLVRLHSPASSASEFVRRQAVDPEPVQLLYGASGYEPDGTAFADAAWMHGRDAESGFIADVGAVGLRAGGQAEAEVTGLRIGDASANGRSQLVLEGLSAGAAVGSHNPDGSIGFNASAGAALVSARGTVDLNGSSVTLGTSVSVSVGLSAGVRDADGDGVPEYCASAAVGLPLSVGVCVEEPSGWDR